MTRKRLRIGLYASIFIALWLLVGIVIYMYVQTPGIRKKVIVETGINTLSLSEFLLEEDDLDHASFQTDLSGINLNTPGEYEIIVRIGRRLFTSELTLVDTTPPTAEIVGIIVHERSYREAEEFVHSIQDNSEVEVTYKGELDFKDLKVGDNEITIVLEDSSGNRTEYKTTLTLLEREDDTEYDTEDNSGDKEPPVIKGVKDRKVTVNKKIDYLLGISASDNEDGTVTVEVDSSQVDLKKVGEYEVVYTAVDLAGNKVEEKARIKVVEELVITEELVYEMADEVLDQIATDGMTKLEVAKAIYDWTGKIKYVGTSDKTNVLSGAYQGFLKKRGDCYTYYAVAEVLLTRAEIDTMCVTRVGGNSSHFWNLVNLGEGWYHFDASPRISGDTFEAFMVTDEEVKAYTESYTKQHPEHPNYYTFDASLYPERAQKEMSN